MKLLRRLAPVPGGIERGFSTVEKLWFRGTVVCIATGPSLTQEQVARVRAHRDTGEVAGVLVVNDAYRLAPWADVCYFADLKWWEWHKDKPEFRAFAGQKCTIFSGKPLPADAAVHVLKGTAASGLSATPEGVATGYHSGHQVLDMAVQSGAVLIPLLGYDGKRSANGMRHWFGNHPDSTEPPYQQILEAMKTVQQPAKARGIRIVNCSPGSAFDCFERAELASLLPDPPRAALPA